MATFLFITFLAFVLIFAPIGLVRGVQMMRKTGQYAKKD